MHFQLKTRALAALLTLALMLSFLPVSLAETYPCAGYTTDSLNLRKRASTNGDLILTIPAGDAVYITGESGVFYIVEYDGRQGYAMKSFISLSQPASGGNDASQEARNNYADLRKGHMGAAVTALQSALIELGFLTGKADGKYGDQTAAAVSAFQKKNDLIDAGTADAATQALLFEGKPKNSKGKAFSVKTLPPIDGYPIQKGDTGAAVERMQTALKTLGYYTGKIDGVCGTGSVSAVNKFKKKNGLTANGVMDAAAQTLLYSGTALSATATATPKPTVTATLKPNIVIGTPAPATFPFLTVTLDSVNLRKRDSISSARILSIPKGASVTVEAVQGDFLRVTYQGSYKTYYGYVMAQYVDVPAEYLGGKTLDDDVEAQKNYTSLSVNASGDAVNALQDALRELGFYSVTSTGLYDVETVRAVKAFQAANGLLQTGFATPELQKLLYEGKPYNIKGKKTDVKTLPPIAGYTMRAGDTGLAVTELQTALLALNYLTALPTGVYDASTVAAVKAFQRNNKLKSDGVAGPKTLEAINALYATPTPPPITLATPTPPPLTADNVIVIHSGTRGAAVTRLQEKLVALGYYSITPDGIYDSNDIAAVRAFQTKNGLKADGVAGLETQLALYADSAMPAWATATPKPTSTPAPAFTVTPNMNITLKIGASGNDVALLQTRLTALLYMSDVIDGRYGTKTALAVTAFQKNNNLDDDGIAGPKTLKKLYASSAKPASASSATATPVPAVDTNENLEVGMTGKAVKAAQTRLIQLGYLTGAADGIFGPKTYLAVKAFQENNGLTGDGVIGAATLKTLNSPAAKSASGETGSVEDSVNDFLNGTNFKAPSASEVRYANWFTEIRAIARQLPNAIVYDYTTGLHYNVNMFSLGKHADSEPITASDTAIMRQIMGVDNWTAHAVWIIFSNGRVYMASTHSKGHDVDHNAQNDLTGHICIHFPRDMKEAEETGPYAVSHQKAINAGWEITQSMAR